MRRRDWIIVASLLTFIVLANVLVRYGVLRIDLTDDQRYSLHDQTKSLLRSLDDEVVVVNYLQGDLNPGFTRLQKSVNEMIDELNVYADIRCEAGEVQQLPEALHPIVIHERQQDGKTVQTTIYPYIQIAYKQRKLYVPLLTNQAGLSGEENLNISMENLEYVFAEALQNVRQSEVQKIAFLEGHGELPEGAVYDVALALSRYFQIDRGVLGEDAQMLSHYSVVVIADPKQTFSERDKFILDQYLMRGGKILWVLNGVQYSEEMLAQQGITPLLPLDLHLEDMLYRYGVRITPAIVEDLQCLSVPVNVSDDPQQTNLQPIPIFFAPLLLTSQESPITKNLTQVSCQFASPIELVGGEDGISKSVLLATSTATKVMGSPAEVNLQDIQPQMNEFVYQYVPIAFSLEGVFPSFFAHRLPPDSLSNCLPLLTQSVATKQVVIGSGSIIQNAWQQGQPLPAGMDRYTGRQFANRDFLVNAVLYLADQGNLIALRNRVVDMRLLNQQVAYDAKPKIQLVSSLTPLLMLLLIGVCVSVIRKHKYANR